MAGFLIIQTAFIGDVVLATALVEKLKKFFPETPIDFLVRKGNEGLLLNNPVLREVLTWEKRSNKLKNLWKVIRLVRARKYDTVINVQRFAATGLITGLSGAKMKVGFAKNPISFLFTKKVKHDMEQGGLHEIERNQGLIIGFTDSIVEKPRLYPTVADFERVSAFKSESYFTISPASVWFTKQYPWTKWVDFLNKIPASCPVYLLGSSTDRLLAEEIKQASIHSRILNLSGQLSFLESAALIRDAAMNYTNDSASLHFASAMNAPVTAIFCSTIPSFGFGPLSDQSLVVEISEQLTCRPCTLHGRKVCPLGHFKCAHMIRDEQLLAAISR